MNRYSPNRPFPPIRPIGFALLLLFIQVSACTDPAPEDPAPRQEAAQPERSVAVQDPCTLLPEAEVEAVIGEPVVARNAEALFGQSVCVYFSKAHEAVPLEQLQTVLQEEVEDLYLELVVTWSGGSAQVRQALEDAGSALQAIEGVGNGAWMSRSVGQRSLLLKGDVLVEFSTALLPKAADYMHTNDHAALRAQFEPLARSVASRL